MKVSILILFGLLSAYLIVFVRSQISIQIQPEDIENLSEFIVNFMRQREVPQVQVETPSSRLKMFNSFSKGTLKMFGLMFTLIGATILSTRFENAISKYQSFCDENN